MRTLMVNRGGAQVTVPYQSEMLEDLGCHRWVFFQNHQWKCQNANAEEEEEEK
jgi:hypothetical protein